MWSEIKKEKMQTFLFKKEKDTAKGTQVIPNLHEYLILLK